jgi:NADH:ubiquinone oxidoreductase subunit 6 (subunit J)
MKHVVLIIIIIIGAVGLEPITTVIADNQGSQEIDEDEENDKFLSSLFLPIIAGIVFVLVLLTILIAQNKLQKKC